VADSAQAAWRLLRDHGPRAFARALVRRVASVPSTWRDLRRPPVSTDLDAAIDYVVRHGMEPGQIVFAMQLRSEISRFLERARALEPRVVVEIGTASGGTLYLLTRVAHPEALIVSIDLPSGRFGGGYGWWRRPLYRSFARAGQRVELLRADSHDPRTAARLRALLGGRAVDLLFLDGDHAYAGVRHDFETYAPLVRPGGLIALHDVASAPDSPEAGVADLWQELRRSRPTEELVDGPDGGGYGIGLVPVPAEESPPAGARYP